MEYGPWMGGVDHVLSHQIFAIKHPNSNKVNIDDAEEGLPMDKLPAVLEHTQNLVANVDVLTDAHTGTCIDLVVHHNPTQPKQVPTQAMNLTPKKRINGDPMSRQTMVTRSTAAKKKKTSTAAIAMSCIGWNCRGLGSPQAIRELKTLI